MSHCNLIRQVLSSVGDLLGGIVLIKYIFTFSSFVSLSNGCCKSFKPTVQERNLYFQILETMFITTRSQLFLIFRNKLCLVSLAVNLFFCSFVVFLTTVVQVCQSSTKKLLQTNASYHFWKNSGCIYFPTKLTLFLYDKT